MIGVNTEHLGLFLPVILARAPGPAGSQQPDNFDL